MAVYLDAAVTQRPSNTEPERRVHCQSVTPLSPARLSRNSTETEPLAGVGDSTGCSELSLVRASAHAEHVAHDWRGQTGQRGTTRNFRSNKRRRCSAILGWSDLRLNLFAPAFRNSSEAVAERARNSRCTSCSHNSLGDGEPDFSAPWGSIAAVIPGIRSRDRGPLNGERAPPSGQTSSGWHAPTKYSLPGGNLADRAPVQNQRPRRG